MTATFSWRQSKRSQPRVDEACLRTYSSHFSDVMEMLAPVASVSAYLDAHQEWFTRCAAPMTVQPLDVNAYRLQLGKFGNFGFEVEPKIDLVLLPQQQGVYRIETLPPSLPLDECARLPARARDTQRRPQADAVQLVAGGAYLIHHSL